MTDPSTPKLVEWTPDYSTDWPHGGPLYRVHQRRFDADSFNPNDKPAYRFSPIYRDIDEPDPTDVVPAWYAGSSVECAVAEALLHDIPMSGGSLAAGVFQNRLVSSVQVLRPLRLVGLDTGGLRKLGLDTKEVTDTEADGYPKTEAFAQRFHDEVPDAQGFVWMSRRWNRDTSVVLYRDRVSAADLRPIALVRDFDTLDDWSWLYDHCKELRIKVRPPIVT